MLHVYTIWDSSCKCNQVVQIQYYLLQPRSRSKPSGSFNIRIENQKQYKHLARLGHHQSISLLHSFIDSHQRIRREVNVWIRLSHDNILPLEGVTEGFGPLPALVTPWMENGSLNDYLRREVHLSEKKKLTMVCIFYYWRQAES
jgi:serine/threonine protein kinase